MRGRSALAARLTYRPQMVVTSRSQARPRATPVTDAPPGGRWSGWWRYTAAELKQRRDTARSLARLGAGGTAAVVAGPVVMELTLRWKAGQVTGKGKDADGAFRVTGTLDGGEVVLTKQYTGKGGLAVRYAGTLRGTRVRGKVHAGVDAAAPVIGTFEIAPD